MLFNEQCCSTNNVVQRTMLFTIVSCVHEQPCWQHCSRGAAQPCSWGAAQHIVHGVQHNLVHGVQYNIVHACWQLATACAFLRVYWLAVSGHKPLCMRTRMGWFVELCDLHSLLPFDFAFPLWITLLCPHYTWGYLECCRDLSTSYFLLILFFTECWRCGGLRLYLNTTGKFLRMRWFSSAYHKFILWRII